MMLGDSAAIHYTKDMVTWYDELLVRDTSTGRYAPHSPMLAGEYEGNSVSVLKWWDLVDIGQKFCHRRRGKQCVVVQIDHGHQTAEPSLVVRFDDGSEAGTEFTSL
jgi:hypothetical protein